MTPKAYGATGLTEKCRTCKGTGKITRKDDEEGVAVISYGDERLAPSRTAIYIIIAVILFLVLTGTLVVLFYPRTVSATSTKLKIIWAEISENNTRLILQDTVNVKNSNYFVSYLDGINVTVQYQKKEVGKYYTDYNSSVTRPSISPRKVTPLNYSVTLDFKEESGSGDIWFYCCLFKYNLGFQIQVNTRFSYFSNKFEFSDSMFLIAHCNEVIKYPDFTCQLQLTGKGENQTKNEEVSTII